MLFEYPYKWYRIGYYLFLACSTYAMFIVLITETTWPIRVFFMLVILLLARGIRHYYDNNVQRLAAYSIRFSKEELAILFNYVGYCYTHDQIRAIYYAEQIESIKLYRVLHIFTVDNQYFYFSNEIVQFNKLVALFEEHYYDKFHRIDHVIKNFKDAEESAYYLEYLKNEKN